MAVFFKRRATVAENINLGNNRVRSPSSPLSTTWLADGYTEDGQLSRYENVRPLSRFSIASTFNSRNRLSSAINTDDISTVSQMIRFNNAGEYVEVPTEPPTGPPPKGTLSKLKYYYDRYRLRHIAPITLLLIYSILGAYLFYIVEHDHEKELLKKEKFLLDQLRNSTLMQLRDTMISERNSEETRLFISRDILVWYEKQLAKTKLPEALEWDMWGAIFYVGTVFTTIGYGNITPRTSAGQALSIAYAIVGIPLVLAILSQFGKALTNWASAQWIKNRQRIKEHKRIKKLNQIKLLRRRRHDTRGTSATPTSTAANSVYNLHILEEGRAQRKTGPDDYNSVNTATLESPMQRLVSNGSENMSNRLDDDDDDEMESR
jgi:hypothetical protein